jgi:dimethylaniline monooxygenase (N-oxide forming)
LSSLMVSADGRDLPLYRRIVRPGVPGLYFAGFVDAPGGLLPVVETQGQWIAAALTGQLRLPPPERMWQAIEQAEPRTRERFPDESPRSVRCDPHAYRRLLHADLRRARRTTLMRNGRVFSIATAVSLLRVHARARVADSA